MARTLTIKIKPVEEALGGFRETFKALESGRRVKRREGVYFTSIEAARNLLTPNRLAVLRAIRADLQALGAGESCLDTGAETLENGLSISGTRSAFK